MPVRPPSAASSNAASDQPGSRSRTISDSTSDSQQEAKSKRSGVTFDWKKELRQREERVEDEADLEHDIRIEVQVDGESPHSQVREQTPRFSACFVPDRTPCASGKNSRSTARSARSDCEPWTRDKRKAIQSLSRSRSVAPAPDGGWGWVVVFASFCICMIADGISFSFGFIFLALSRHFNQSKGKTALVGSLFLSIPLLLGPFASALTAKYGCRKITILSGLISSFGFILGHFATSIEHLFVAFSIAGAGLALSYVTSIVIVAYYFEKRRSLATGLAVCGTGVGTFTFAPLTIYLLAEYSWRGTLLIMAAFFLNFLVFGSLMRDLPEEYLDTDASESSSAHEAEEGMNTPANGGTASQAVGDAAAQSLMPAVVAGPRASSSLVSIPTFLSRRESLANDPEVMNELTRRKGGVLSTLIQKYPHITSLLGRNERSVTNRVAGRPVGTVTVLSAAVEIEVTPPEASSATQWSSKARLPAPKAENAACDAVKSPIKAVRQRRSIVNPVSHRLTSLVPFEQGCQARRLQRGSVTYRSAMLNLRRHRLRSSSCPDIVTVSGSSTDSEPEGLTQIKHLFADIIDVSVFRSWRYSLFCFSNLLLYACIDVPYVYIPDHAITSGAAKQEEASFLISLIGIVNTVGIVLVGYVGDKPWLRPSLLYSCLVTLSGLSIGLIPLTNSFRALAVLSACYGCTISANYALVSVILVDLVSLDKFTIAYGLLLLVQGIASLVGPPFAGWLCDVTGSYDVTFFVTGMCIVVSGLVVLPVGRSRGGRS